VQALITAPAATSDLCGAAGGPTGVSPQRSTRTTAPARRSSTDGVLRPDFNNEAERSRVGTVEFLQVRASSS